MDQIKSKRVENLKAMMLQYPEDPFFIYALALELREIDKNYAGLLFDQLLLDFPEYHPTYLISAQFFAESGEHTKAKEIFEKGIACLSFLQEPKALAEIKNAYQNFLFEE